MPRRALASSVLVLVAVFLLAPCWLVAAAAALPIGPAVHERDGAVSTGASETRRTRQPLGGFILTAADGATATPLSQADVLERIERRLRAVPDYPPYLYEIKRLSDAIAVVWMNLTARRHAAYDQSYYAAIDYIERERLALIRARRLAGDGELRAAIDLLGEAERFRKISHAFTEAATAAFESDIATGEYWAKAAYESSRAAAIFAGAVHGPAGMQAVDALFLASDFFVDWTQVGLEQAAADTFSRAATKLLLTQVPLPTIQAETGNALAASFNHHFAGRTFEAALADGSTTILGAQVAPYIAAALEAPTTRERLLALLMGGVEHTLARHLVGPALDAAFAGYRATLTEPQPAEQATELATRMEAAGLRLAQQALAREILEAFDGDIDTIRLVASHAEHAWLAAAAYGDERGQPYQHGTSVPLPGWTVADVFLIENTFTGDLSATLFAHEDGRVVLAFRGTESAGDWLTNLAAVTGIPTSQIVQAEEIAKSIAIQHPQVVFVGHSLGGRLANIARKITGKDAVVFNPAPHSAKELSMKSVGGNLLAFRSPDDRVSVLTATRDIEVANFHRYDTANSLLRTGPELWFGQKYDHKINHLAGAMRVVEIALPWIEQAMGTAVAEAEPLGLLTADDLQAACSAGNAESCVTLGEIDAGESVARLPETPNPVRMVAHGFDNQGIDFVYTVLIRRVEAGVEVVLEELIGSHVQGATFNPVETNASFSIGLHVTARRNCEGCRPTFTRQSEPVGEFGNGRIEVTNLPVSVLIPEADIGQADEIGWAVWGGSTLFLFPNSKISVAELMGDRDGRGGEQELGVAAGDVDRAAPPAEQTLKAACTAGDTASCVGLGKLYATGEGVEKDLARAAELYRQACEAGSGEGCARIAGLYYKGEAVDKDLPLAADFYRKGCAARERSACAWLGYLYENGQGVQVDLARATDLYRQSCEASDAWSCNQLGYSYQLGRGVDKDLALAASFYQLACQQGNMAGCGSLAVQYTTGQGVETDLARAVELFITACDGKEPYSCNNLGVAYRDGTGVEQDQAKAAALFQQACDGAVLEGCNNLGMLYRTGKAVEQDHARAAELFQQACDGQNALSCNNLGVIYRDGTGGEQNQAKAASLFLQACDGKNALGCNNLAALYATGRGVEKDEAVAAKLYQQACERGLARGCFNLAVAYVHGRGVEKDLERAAVLHQQACEGRHADGCTAVGISFQIGIGVEQNFSRAADFFQRACEGGNTQECGALADLFFEGKGVGQDFARAAILYRRACDGGHADSCNKLGNSYASGQGVQSDAAEAAKYYQQACTGGDLFGCRNLAARYYQGNGVPKDLPRAADLYRQACDKDDAPSCSILGMFYQAGIGVEQDVARATELFRRACEGGYETACTSGQEMSQAGASTPTGQSDERDLASAAASRPADCEKGNASSCNALGRLYESGQTVEMDVERAVALYRQACDGGDTPGCKNRDRLANAEGWITSKNGCRLNVSLINRLYPKTKGMQFDWTGNCQADAFKLPAGYGRLIAYNADNTVNWYWPTNLEGDYGYFFYPEGDLGFTLPPYNFGGIDNCALAIVRIIPDQDYQPDVADSYTFNTYLRLAANHAMKSCNRQRYEGIAVSIDLPGYNENPGSSRKLWARTKPGGSDKLEWGEYINSAWKARSSEIGADNRAMKQRAAQAERERIARERAVRIERLAQELAQRVEGWLSSSGVIENVADAMQHDRVKTMSQLSAGKHIRVTVTPPSFSDGRFIIHNRVSAFNVDQAAGDTGFSWDRWLQTTQNFGQGVYTVVCRFAANQAGSLTEGTSIVVMATMVAAGTNDIVLDCAL